MSTTATILSASAASLAAILAGVNLYVSGRRADIGWSRTALVDALTEFLDASFQGKDAAKSAVRLLLGGGNSAAVATFHDEAVAAAKRMRTLQTRLRLLAPQPVVAAAQALRSGVEGYVATIEQPASLDAASDEATREQLWRLREAFVDAAKRALAL